LIGVLIVTHGGLANELLAAARVIAGELPNFRALPLAWSEGLEQARERIAAELSTLDTGEGVLILTDMFGDTPSNAALALRAEGRVEVISGVNLPMVVRLGCSRASAAPVGETARWLEIKGRRSIARATGPAIDPRLESECEDD
jgi:PTS system mannose-specific IIA component